MINVFRTGLNCNSLEDYLKKMKELREKTDSLIILVVPDQLSYTAEKNVCGFIGGTGINGVQVFTFHQLIRFLITDDKKALSAVGKQLLIKRISKEFLDEKSIFYSSRNKMGFYEEILSVIDEWRRNGLTIDALNKQTENVSDKLLLEKLNFIGGVYEKYVKCFEDEKYMDETMDLEAVAGEILLNEQFRNSYVFFDQFTDFLPPHLEIIKSLQKMGAEITFYFNAKPEKATDGVFLIPEKGIEQIKKLADEFGYVYNEEILEKKAEKSLPLSFFCDNYDSVGRTYNDECDKIRISAADSIYEEVEAMASGIVDLVCEEGFKYSEIAVMCGNLDNYLQTIESIMKMYSIPYYTDYKTKLINHPVAVLINSLFGVVYKQSFGINQMLSYLKTGLVVDSFRDVSMIELYIRRYGIRGSMWKNEKYFNKSTLGFFDEYIKGSKENKSFEYLNALREKIITPLVDFYEKTKGKKKASFFATALFEYFRDIELFDKISRKIKRLRAEELENDAAEYEYIWNVLMDILDQIVLSAGDDVFDREGFFEYVQMGIEGSQISLIPAVQNGVSIGDSLSRNPGGIKALFIIDASLADFPKKISSLGILSEDERKCLDEININTNLQLQNDNYKFKMLRGIADCSNKLFISYGKMSHDGTKYNPSQLIDDVLELFPRLNIQVRDKNQTYISTPEITFHKLLVQMSRERQLPTAWKYIKEWFGENNDYADKLEILGVAQQYMNERAELSADVASKLYEKYSAYSVSRLEQYFMCPFSYYLSNGLMVNEFEDYGIKSSDTGSLLHYAVSKFCQKVDDGAEDLSDKKEKWAQLDNEKISKYVSDIMDEVKNGSENHGVISQRMSRIYSSMENNLLSTAKEIALSINNSAYTLAKCEFDFDGFSMINDQGSIGFHGIIDRIDVFSNKIRIVDYKSKKKSISVNSILNCANLQLIIYAMAAKKMFGEKMDAEITGMFYKPINKSVAVATSPEEAQGRMIKERRFSGMLLEHSIGKREAIENGPEMDCDFLVNKYSNILPIELNKTGDSYKKNTSSVFSTELLEALMKIVKDRCIDADKKIKEGDISVYPLKPVSKTCMFCKFSTICMYDAEKGAETNPGVTKEDFPELGEE